MPPQRTENRSGGRAVAVHIGDSSVRVAEVLDGRPASAVARFGSAPISEDVWGDLSASKGRLADAIRSACAAASIRPGPVTLALPRRLITLKFARLPHAAPELVEGMVHFEAQQYIPFPIEEVVLGHQIVSEEGDEMMTVIVLAARRSLVEGLVAACEQAGYEPERITVTSAGLAALAPADSLTSAVLLVDRRSADLAVVNAGKLQFSRSVAFRSDITSESGAAELMEELSLSLTAYRNEFRGQAVHSLYLAGAAECIAVAEKALGGIPDLTVSRIRPSHTEALGPEACSYAAAIGIAREGLSGSTIDLTPPERGQRKQAAIRRTRGAIATLAAAAAVLIAVMVVQDASAKAAVERRRSVAANRELSRTQTRHDHLKQEHERLRKTHVAVQTGLARDYPVVEAIRVISSAAPRDPGTHLSQLTFERAGTITIQGRAKTQAAATEFVLALQKAGSFEEARITYVGDAQSDKAPGVASAAAALSKPSVAPEEITFTLSCQLKKRTSDSVEDGATSRVLASNERGRGSP